MADYVCDSTVTTARLMAESISVSHCWSHIVVRVWAEADVNRHTLCGNDRHLV